MVIKPFLLLSLLLNIDLDSGCDHWSTIVRRPSEVYDTHRRTMFTEIWLLPTKI